MIPSKSSNYIILLFSFSEISTLHGKDSLIHDSLLVSRIPSCTIYDLQLVEELEREVYSYNSQVK